MEQFRIERTGLAPIEFAGELLAEVSGKQMDAQAVRWHELRVYRTSGGKHVLEIDYRTTWRGETGHRTVEVVKPSSLAETLVAVDPVAHVGGFPPLPEYAERQERLKGYLRGRFRQLITNLLGELGGVAERID